MSDEIRPALTAEEWEGARGRDARSRLCETANYVQYHEIEGAAAEYVEAMALANEALPDGHPQKIVASDVSALRVVLGEWRAYAGAMSRAAGFPSHEMWEDATLSRLAAKLAALLPPEGT